MIADPTPQPVVTTPKKITTKQSARRKLELSLLQPRVVQQEAMGLDVGVDRLVVFLASQVKMELADRITDASISRTIDGSSVLTITINDYDRALLQSGLLYNKLDVQLDGLWFRLMGVDKSGDELTLTFEDREIAVLRTYTSWKVALRSKVTRAEFVLSLIREVQEFQIPVVIPELHTVQPLQKYDGDTAGYDAIMYKVKGIPKDYTKTTSVGNPHKTWIDITKKSKLTVEGHPINKEQRDNAGFILAVGDHMKVSRKFKVCAIMTAMTEARLYNHPEGDGTSVGLFQQIDQYWGSFEDRMNPETSSRMFYEHLQKYYDAHPDASYNDLCQGVQGSGYPDRYGKFRWEAESLVTAFGDTGGDWSTIGATYNGSNVNPDSSDSFYFYRGNIENRKGQKVRKPQNSWDCIVGLADDVNWRAFFVSGMFYFISEDDLIKQEPAAIITEWTDGIKSIDGNFYEHKKSATLEIKADVGKWAVAPGRLVIIQDMGPWDGRWLVSEFERSLFELEATITLSRERPALPEPNPIGGNAQDINPSWVPTPGSAQPGTQSATQGTPESPKVSASRIQLAKELLALQNHGWVDVNHKGYQQIFDTAQGKHLYHPVLGECDLDVEVLAVVLWLIQEKKFEIGTYAWCTDHHDDGVHGHAGGHAVDIELINGKHISELSLQCKKNVLAVDQLLYNLKGDLAPRQLITGGYGNIADSDIVAYTLPKGWAYNEYDAGTMKDHFNHIHVGY